MLLPKPLSIATVAAVICCLDVASGFYAITGVKTGVTSDGFRPARRNINDLVNDVNQFSLYIQAMTSMMAVDENNITSWFQVSGVHGRPYIAWDNVNPTTPDPTAFPTGYCTHGQVLFPTWHRPYLALFEQVLASHAQTAAKAYNSAAWQKAADNLRIPFWDWAAAPQGFPDVMTWPSIRITTPTGVKNVTNPLYRYKFRSHPEPQKWFPTDGGDWDAYLGSQPWTLRWPDANNITHDESINIRLAGDDIPAGLRQQVYNVFSRNVNYNTMASTDNRGATFENPHNSMHVWVGGDGNNFGGFMSSVPFSAFDPAFWLHHTNVDRQIAMWQAIYPNKWITATTSGGSTWTIKPGDTLDENTPLTPFTMADGKTRYTSKTSRYVKNFGYSYPDVKDWLFTSPAKLAANVTARVNQLYNTDGTLGPLAVPQTIAGRVVTKRDETRAWTVYIKVPNNATESAFSVKFAAGGSPLGDLVIMAPPSRQEIAAGAVKVTYGQFSLNEALNGIQPTDVPSVVAHLKNTLKWQVVKRDGTVVDSVKGLELQVAEQIVTPAADITEFPVYGKETFHPEVFG